MISPSTKEVRFYIVTWIAFLLSLPLGIQLGIWAAYGQDIAGRGISIAFGELLGILGAAVASVANNIIAFRMRKESSRSGKIVLAVIPWLFLGLYCYVMLFTSLGDRLFEKLEFRVH
jgi:hypothetical protein